MIDFLAVSKEPDYGITDEMKALLVPISGAQADRLLKSARKALEIRGHDPGGGRYAHRCRFKPILTARRPCIRGKRAFDTVAHCGGSASGHFCKTLTGTSPYSGWVEERSLLNSANKWVAEAIEDIRSGLPFPLTGGHYDNGIEFINKPELMQWKSTQNPVVLNSRLNKAVERLLKTN
jgi:hypothetical protein